MKPVGYRLAPDTLVAAAHAVVRKWQTGDLARVVRDLADALQQLESLSLPVLGVVVRRGRVEALISDRPDILAPMLQDAIVIDYDLQDTVLVTKPNGRATTVSVTSHTIGPPQINLEELMSELDRIAAEKKR